MTTRQLLFIPLLLAVAMQTGHYVEHIAQVIQIYWQYVAPANAHGLLGEVFDFEWVHFAYNLSLEVMLIGLWLAYRSTRPAPSTPAQVGLRLLAGLALFQGYHSIEHISKLYQYLFVPLYQSGMPPTPGLLPLVTGWRIFVVHFWLNTIVWVGMALAVWYLRPSPAVPPRARSDLRPTYP